MKLQTAFICREADNPSTIYNNRCTGRVTAKTRVREFYGPVAVGKCPRCKEVKVQLRA